MQQQLERHNTTVEGRDAALDPYDTVFPRWFTLFVMVAWMAVMGWAITYSTITLT